HHPSGRATAPSGAEPRYASTSTHRVTSHRRAVAGKAGSYSTTWVMGARCAGTRVRKRSHAIDTPADGVRPIRCQPSYACNTKIISCAHRRDARPDGPSAHEILHGPRSC